MSQSIVLILTNNVQSRDIETCPNDKWDASVMSDMGDGLTIQVAQRDKFGVSVEYVTVSEFPPREYQRRCHLRPMRDRTPRFDPAAHSFRKHGEATVG